MALFFLLKFGFIVASSAYNIFKPILPFQRAWLLKLLAVELHSGDIASSSHRETCRKILGCLFGKSTDDEEGNPDFASSLAMQNEDETTGTRTYRKNKAQIYTLLKLLFWFLINI